MNESQVDGTPEGFPAPMSAGRMVSVIRSTARRSWLVAACIVLLGLFLRLYYLDYQSLWDDEVFSLSVSRLPIDQMHPILVTDVVHPPVHYYVLHAWSKLVGSTPFHARLLSAIFGTLAIVVVYFLARYLFDPRTAVLSALLLAVSQISIQFSQEARPYAQVSFLALCSSYFFIRALFERRALFWWLSVGAVVLTVQSHYFGSFLIPSFVVVAAVFRKEHRLPTSWWIGGAALVLGAWAAWLASGVLHEALYGPKMVRSLGKSFSQHWYSALELAAVFNNARANGIAEPVVPWSYVLGGAVFCVPALTALIPSVWRRTEGSDPRPRNSSIILIVLVAVPALLALATGRVLRFYDARYVGYCAAFYYILVARGWILLKPPALRAVAIVIGLALSTYALRAVYFIPYKQNYRDALAYVSGHSRAGDCYAYEDKVPLLRGVELKRAWAFYQAGQPEWAIEPVESVALRPCQRVWLVSTWLFKNPAIIAAVRRAEETLEKDYTQTDMRSYYRVQVDLFERKSRQPPRAEVQ